jgi:uncharacterized membrane protein HdeD (DUF308 family)
MSYNTSLPWWLGVLTGLVFILVGVAMVVNPALAALDLIVLLGLYWLIAGIIDTIALVFDRSKLLTTQYSQLLLQLNSLHI